MTEKDMAKQHAAENHAAARLPAEQPSGKQMPERQTVKAEAAEEKAMEKETGKKKREAEGNYKRDTQVKRVLSYIGAYRLLVLFSLVLARGQWLFDSLHPHPHRRCGGSDCGKGTGGFSGTVSDFPGNGCGDCVYLCGPVADECHQQPYHLPGGHGHQDEGFQPSGIPSPALYRQPSVRGYSEPDYYGCGSVLRRPADGLYPAFFRGAHDSGDAGFHVLHQSGDCTGGCPGNAPISVCGQLYCEKDLPHV